MSNDVELIAVRGSEAEIRVGGKTHLVPFVVSGTQVHFAYDGEIWSVEIAQKARRAKKHGHSLEAPMPGVVLKIVVKPGDAVDKGAPLIILEAMKMEHTIVAPNDGTIAAVNCKEGEMVQPGVDLVTMS